MICMKAVILAAGEGKRMRPLTYERPKVMLPIAGKPIIEHLLEEIKEVGINDFVFVVGYHDETIRDYFGKGEKWGVNIQYVTQKTQLGTADALRKTEGLVEDKFVLLNGDTIVSAEDIEKVITGDVDTALGVLEVRNPEDYGVVETKGEKITKIHEKMKEPPSNMINAGIYLLTENIFDALSKTAKSKRGEFELTDSLQLMIESGKEIFWRKIEHWIDVSYPWDLLAANELLIDKKPFNKVSAGIEENVCIKDKVSIGEGTVIKSGSYIEGPVVIGKNCKIGPNSYIRANTSIGDDCHIGSGVEIKNSIIMDGTKIPHLSYVGDSVIGCRCNLGAGTKIANLRFDDTHIKARGLDTGRRKLGAIISDGVKTGINACIDAGAIIGNNTLIGPGAFASGYIEENSRIY